MADNVTAPATGAVFATDDVASVQYPRTKISIGADGAAADVHVGNPMPIIGPYLTAGTDRSGTIATGGTAQVLAAANATRRALYGQNVSAGDIWINEVGGTAAVGAAGSYKVVSGDSFSISTNRAISIIGTTTGQAFTAVEI